jgi:PIN domain nuclease of toxin-antitoxin system
VRYLLDTHVWIWAFEGSNRLGMKCRKALAVPSAERLVSPVSTMEIARLVARGEMELACPLKLRTIELDHASAIEAYTLPEPFHQDPADRLLVAAARVHDLRIATADSRILQYGSVASLPAQK